MSSLEVAQQADQVEGIFPRNGSETWEVLCISMDSWRKYIEQMDLGSGFGRAGVKQE